jgi:hypothetical protein
MQARRMRGVSGCTRTGITVRSCAVKGGQRAGERVRVLGSPRYDRSVQRGQSEPVERRRRHVLRPSAYKEERALKRAERCQRK